jgi:hypothetical protein
MTLIAQTCGCGRPAEIVQLGWGFCKDCYLELVHDCVSVRIHANEKLSSPRTVRELPVRRCPAGKARLIS